MDYYLNSSKNYKYLCISLLISISLKGNSLMLILGEPLGVRACVSNWVEQTRLECENLS